MKLTNRLTLLILGLLLVMVFPVAAQEDQTIFDIASGSTEFETLVAALQATGMDSDLGGGGAYTVFAPTDAAFNRTLEQLGLSDEELLANVDLLEEILSYTECG